MASVLMETFLPSIDDHIPSSYFASLQAVEVAKRGKEAVHERLTPGSDVDYRGEKGGLGGETEQMEGYQTNINNSPDIQQRQLTLAE